MTLSDICLRSFEGRRDLLASSRRYVISVLTPSSNCITRLVDVRSITQAQETATRQR